MGEWEFQLLVAAPDGQNWVVKEVVPEGYIDRSMIEHMIMAMMKFVADRLHDGDRLN